MNEELLGLAAGACTSASALPQLTFAFAVNGLVIGFTAKYEGRS